jgi:hypothetical protein
MRFGIRAGPLALHSLERGRFVMGQVIEADRDLGFGFSAVIPAEKEGLGRFFLP